MEVRNTLTVVRDAVLQSEQKGSLDAKHVPSHTLGVCFCVADCEPVASCYQKQVFLILMPDLNEFPFSVHARRGNRFLKRRVIKLNDRLRQLRLRDARIRVLYCSMCVCLGVGDAGADGVSLSHVSSSPTS